MNDDMAEVVGQVAAEAEATREQAMPPGATGVRAHKSVSIAIRLAPGDAAAIEALAARLDVPTSALVRGWILAALTANNTENVTAAIDRLAADVQRLRELVA